DTRRCQEFADLLTLEPETRCNCPEGLLRRWESDRMFAAQSRRDKAVGVVLQEAWRLALSKQNSTISVHRKGCQGARRDRNSEFPISFSLRPWRSVAFG